MGRDHSVECPKCGASYGGFNGPDECPTCEGDALAAAFHGQTKGMEDVSPLADLRAQLATAKAEVERLREALEARNSESYRNAQPAIAKADRLAEALREYGEHLHNCEQRTDGCHGNPAPCTCGLDAALSANAPEDDHGR
jgi:uncharacterized Zn finger protein (UPF0148 family)